MRYGSNFSNLVIEDVVPKLNWTASPGNVRNKMTILKQHRSVYDFLGFQFAVIVVIAEYFQILIYSSTFSVQVFK